MTTHPTKTMTTNPTTTMTTNSNTMNRRMRMQSPRPGSWLAKLTLAIAAAAIVLAASPRDAAAARIPVIYQTGQDGFVCGPLPAPYDKEPSLAGFQAGYLCDITGVFWTYFYVRDCKPVALQGDSYNDSPELAAAIQATYAESTMQRGIWNHYGWMLMAALAALGVGMSIKSAITGKEE
jgi:hypothetical protein